MDVTKWMTCRVLRQPCHTLNLLYVLLSVMSFIWKSLFLWKPISKKLLLLGFRKKEFGSRTIGHCFDDTLTQQLHNIGTISCLGQGVKKRGFLHDYFKHRHARRARFFCELKASPGRSVSVNSLVQNTDCRLETRYKTQTENKTVFSSNTW